VSRGWDSTTRFWDPHGGQELLRVRGTSFLQFSRDGRRLAFRGYNARDLGVWELAPRDECRLLYGQQASGAQAHAGVAFAPGGRLLATGAGDGTCLWDARSGRLLARLDTGPTRDVLFDPQGRYLMTAGDAGCRYYSLHQTSDGGGERWRVGPPLTVPRPLIGAPFQLHCDGRGEGALVVDRARQVIVFRPGERPWAPVVLRGHANVSYAALSPDGRYVATGTWRGAGVRVWAADTGRPVAALPAEGSAGVAFTPDGGRLLVLESEGDYRTYRVGGWELESSRHDPEAGFTRGFRVAFPPGGRVMAYAHDRVNLRLMDVAGGEEVALLRLPESQNLAAYQFSPDGRYLAAVTVRGVTQLWDLYRLRDRLEGIGLSWPAVAGCAAPVAGGAESPLRVEVVTGEPGA
jgi:WD40 repeat protein